MRDSRVTTSIVVATRNRAHLLPRAIEALQSQTLPRESYELVVVDDHSSDGTAKLLESYQASENVVCVRSEKHLGISGTRQLGIGMSRGECILFTDDDCVPNGDWIECMLARLHKHSLVMGCVALREKSRYWLTCFNIANFHPFLKGRHERRVRFVSFNNFGFRRGVADDLGGLSTDFAETSDTEYGLRAQRKGYSVVFAPEAIVVHAPDNISGPHAMRYAARHASLTILSRHAYADVLGLPYVMRTPVLLFVFAPFIALGVTLGIYLGNRRLLPLLWTLPAVFALKMAWCWGASRGLKKLLSQKGSKPFALALKEKHNASGISIPTHE